MPDNCHGLISQLLQKLYDFPGPYIEADFIQRVQSGLWIAQAIQQFRCGLLRAYQRTGDDGVKTQPQALTGLGQAASLVTAVLGQFPVCVARRRRHGFRVANQVQLHQTPSRKGEASSILFATAIIPTSFEAARYSHALWNGMSRTS